MNTTNRNARSSFGRALALIGTGALLLALLPAAAAFADHGQSRGTQAVCPAPGGNQNFTDVEGDTDSDSAAEGTHANNIGCIGGWDIVDGYADGSYGPSDNIRRDQMASFIVGLIETATGTAMPAGQDAFDDDDGNTHEANINKLAEAGVVQGLEPAGSRVYDPDGNVDRAQMATYIANANDWIDDSNVNGSEPPASQDNAFDDDDANVHHDNINRLAAQHIVVGYADADATAGDDYRPTADVTRAQMATFVMQDADYKNSLGLFPGGGDVGGDPSDDTRPLLTAAEITTAGTNTAWDEIGDVLTLTFSEAVNDTDNDNNVGEAQVEAILGTTITYAEIEGAPDSAVTIFSDGTTTVTLTISGATLAEGVIVGDSVPGTLNAHIRDLAGNRQDANPDPAQVT